MFDLSHLLHRIFHFIGHFLKHLLRGGPGIGGVDHCGFNGKFRILQHSQAAETKDAPQYQKHGNEDGGQPVPQTETRQIHY